MKAVAAPNETKPEKILKELSVPVQWQRADDLFNAQMVALQPLNLTEIPRKEIEAVMLESDPLEPDTRTFAEKEALIQIKRYRFSRIALSEEQNKVGKKTNFVVRATGIAGPAICLLGACIAKGLFNEGTISAIAGSAGMGALLGTLVGPWAQKVRQVWVAPNPESPHVVKRLIKKRHREIARLEDLRENFNDRDTYRRKLSRVIDKVYSNG